VTSSWFFLSILYCVSLGWNCIHWGGWLPGSGFTAGCRDVSLGTSQGLTRLRFPSCELTTASSHEFVCLLPTTLCTRDSLVWHSDRLTFGWVIERSGAEETHRAQVGTRFVGPVAVVNDLMPVDWVDPETGANPDLWVLKLVQFRGSSLRKRMQSYELKNKYESEFCSEWEREIATNYQFRKDDKYYRYHKIQKNNQIFLTFRHHASYI